MPNCAVIWCNNQSKNVNKQNSGVTYHMFSRDPNIKDKWILATGKCNWFPQKHDAVCSQHFEAECFMRMPNYTRLFFDAIPTLKLHPIFNEMISIKMKHDTHNTTYESSAKRRKVKYPSGVEVKEGNELTPTQVKDVPQVSWDADPNTYYTLAMTDPDAPSRAEPTYREWLHWLVGNVRGAAVADGAALAAYVGSGPPPRTGLHRYVFLVYAQPGKIEFDEPRLTNTSGKNRGGFSIAKFAKKYSLGDPIAGNFYQAQYDDYVPILYKQLGE